MCELWTLNIFIGKAIFTSSQPEPTNILGWINFVVVGLPGIDQPGDHGAVVRRGGENLAN